MTKYGIKLVCFDLDNTLINNNSWVVINKALGVTIKEDEYYLNKYINREITYFEWTKILLGLYKDRGRANLDNILKVVSQFKYKKGTDRVIDLLKRKGYQVIIISGAIDLLVKMMGEQLLVEAKATSRLVFDESGMLTDMIVEDDDKNVKLNILKKVVTYKNIKLNECACIGDGDNDINIFTHTEHGITFNHSSIKDQAWKLIKSLDNLNDIL